MLGNHELLLIWRKRQKITQRAASVMWRVSLYRYRQWEDGKVFGPRVQLNPPNLAAHEHILLLRYRGGMTSTAAAKAMGVSREWTRLMEDGQVTLARAIAYWGDEDENLPEL